MNRSLAWVLISVVVATTAAESAPRRKRPDPAPPTKQLVQEQDEFRTCDVAVREFVQGRKEAAALPVKVVKADGLRMTLNFVHPYGESGDTPPNLSFTRGESVEERRRALNETKQRVRMLEEAARTGNVWYAIVLNDKRDSPDARRNPTSGEPETHQTSASAAVFANIENRCITVYEDRSVALDRLSPEARALLAGPGQSPPSAETSAAVPPS